MTGEKTAQPLMGEPVDYSVEELADMVLEELHALPPVRQAILLHVLRSTSSSSTLEPLAAALERWFKAKG